VKSVRCKALNFAFLATNELLCKLDQADKDPAQKIGLTFLKYFCIIRHTPFQPYIDSTLIISAGMARCGSAIVGQLMQDVDSNKPPKQQPNCSTAAPVK
jgi:hypothetical protein